jgi:hypothetical protein
MLVSLYIVQRENRPVAGGKLSNRLIERDPINDRHGIRILGPFDDLDRGLAVFGRVFHTHAALAKVHQNLVDRQAVQPCCEGGLAAKASYFAKELYENLLSEVFSLRNVLRHSKAEGINATVVTLVKLLEGLHVAGGGLLRQRVVRTWRCLGFGCGHESFVLLDIVWHGKLVSNYNDATSEPADDPAHLDVKRRGFSPRDV